MRETAQKMYDLAPDQKRRRTDVMRSVRLTQAFQSMLGHEDPVIALVETWSLTVRLVDYFQTGHGQTLYGDHQDVVIGAAKRLEADIEQIGQQFLSENKFAQARKQVEQFARRQPINEAFSNLVTYATAARPGEPSPFADIVSIPMAPLAAMQGVDRTASAIYGVRDSMERISDIAHDFPESVRWHLLLLLMDLEEAETVKSLVNSASALSESSVKLAATTETLPKELRRDALALVEAIDDRQKNIQITLDKAEATTAAIDKGFVTARDTIEKTAQTAESIHQMAEEWGSAAKATNDLIQSVRQWRDSKPKTEAGPTTTVQDYQETLQRVTNATDELQVLVADVRGLIESSALTARIDELNGCLVSAVDRSAVQAGELTDHIAWRLVQLSAVIALAVLGCKFLAVRLLRRQG
ncbi:MAG: hypothetical protein JSW27_01895 [Phycisphaerales bacterium]|nr:MAG: hypothetical protein JSW27_01895 [Phycisphaerales bacterium]